MTAMYLSSKVLVILELPYTSSARPGGMRGEKTSLRKKKDNIAIVY
jgi:hypothetical protein